MNQHIILVEDSNVQAMQIQNYLQQYGLRIEIVASGYQAITLIRQSLPAVVILDVELPDLNGYAICRSIKNDPSTAHIPVVMLTMRDTHQDALDGLIHGAVDYIAKDAFAPTNLLVSLRALGIFHDHDLYDIQE